MAAALNALGRHLALAGFMGAGKTTVGAELAEALGRPFVDVDAEVEQTEGMTIADIFERRGEEVFRAVEEALTLDALHGAEPAVVALGGGAVRSAAVREALAARAFTALLDVPAGVAWERVQGGDRPLARDREAFTRLHAEREPLYDAVADARVTDAEGAALAAAGVVVESGALARLGELVPGDGPVELVADATVDGLYGAGAREALGARLVAAHQIPAGEEAKSAAELQRLWSALRIGRDGVVAALGGGCTTDLAGFAAATYMRGVTWCAVPTTLVGQVDAAVGGKTAIDLPHAKNIVGAFHWPVRVVADPALLATLPEAERLNGMAEAVKTGLLAGRPTWELPDEELVRACAAYKAALCLRDPHDRGPRNVLNLGHTFAHALEAAAGYGLPHGRAVALGLTAALRLSGNDEALAVVEQVLAPEPVRVDREAAWAALARDKKAERGSPRLVLLEQNGAPRFGVEVPAEDVRRALDALIA